MGEGKEEWNLFEQSNKKSNHLTILLPAFSLGWLFIIFISIGKLLVHDWVLTSCGCINGKYIRFKKCQQCYLCYITDSIIISLFIQEVYQNLPFISSIG